MSTKKSKLAARAERLLRRGSDDPKRMNARRAKWAGQTLDYYTNNAGEAAKPSMTKAQRLDLKRQNLSDLLCQFAHLCDRDGIDFMERLHVAEYHYREETGKKGKQLFVLPAVPKTRIASLSGAVRDFVRMAAAGNTDADDLQKLACDLLGRKHPARMPAPMPAPAATPAPPDSKRAAYIAQAREQYVNDDTQIDDHAAISEVNEAGEPKGAWVAAWVWVNEEEATPAPPAPDPDAEKFIRVARSSNYAENIEFDSEPVVSRGKDGASVQAWFWISNEEAGIPAPEDLDHPQTDEHLAACPECMRSAVNAAAAQLTAAPEDGPGVTHGRCVTEEELAEERARLNPAERDLVDALPTAADSENDPEVIAAREQVRAALAPITESLTRPPAPLQVVIEINEGVADIHTCPENVDVRIIDWDMFECGDHTLTGENAVTEELRAWIEANEPEWYAEQLERETAIAKEKIPAQVRKARAGIIPHDPQNDDPEPPPEHCSHKGCTTLVNPEDPYFATPCGTYCSVHMRQHVKSCEVCRNEFTD